MKNIAAFYDLDKTIINANLYSIFFQSIIKTDKKFASFIYIPLLYILSKIIKNYEFIRHGMLRSLNGYNKGILSKRWNSYLKENINEIIIPDIKKSITTHITEGHKIFILTNNIEVLVEPLANLLNFNGYSAINIETDKNGILRAPNIFTRVSISKKDKLNDIVSKYDIDKNKSFGYGDSEEDYLFLNELGNAYLIKGNHIVKYVFNKVQPPL